MIVEINNSWQSTLDNFSNESYKFLKESGHLKEKERETEKDGKKFKYIDLDFKIICPIIEVPICLLNNQHVRISFYKGLKSMTENYFNKHDMVDVAMKTGGDINLYMPSNELLDIVEVTWLEDACTEELQRRLNEGFKIIACIPRAGQRRPDYVLGLSSATKRKMENEIKSAYDSTHDDIPF